MKKQYKKKSILAGALLVAVFSLMAGEGFAGTNYVQYQYGSICNQGQTVCMPADFELTNSESPSVFVGVPDHTSDMNQAYNTCAHTAPEVDSFGNIEPGTGCPVGYFCGQSLS